MAVKKKAALKRRHGRAEGISRQSTAQLFLCHSHKDKPFVRRLARDLSELGVDVWMDEWELSPGDSLHTCIGTALSSIAFVGVVLSPASAKSKWCQSELEHALAREKQKGRTIAIPLLYRKVEPPPFLLGRLYADFTNSYFGALAQVAGFIHDLPVREVREQIVAANPATVESVKTCLEAAGWNGIKYLDEDDYTQLVRLLGKAGIKIKSDEFDIVRPVSKRAASTFRRSKRFKLKK